MPSWSAAGAVRGLLAGETGEMVTLLPLSDHGETGYSFVALEAVAEVERPIPAAWTRDGAIPVGDEFFSISGAADWRACALLCSFW